MNGHYYCSEIAVASHQQRLYQQAEVARQLSRAGQRDTRPGLITGFLARRRAHRAQVQMAPAPLVAVLAPVSLDESPAVA